MNEITIISSALKNSDRLACSDLLTGSMSTKGWTLRIGSQDNVDSMFCFGFKLIYKYYLSLYSDIYN